MRRCALREDFDRAMHVILLQDVGGVGKRYEIKNVSDGHAFNFLIPRGLAEQATPEKLASHEKRMKESIALREKEEDAMRSKVEGLRGASIQLSARATERGGLFKTIGAKEIAAALREQKNIALPTDSIKPLEPIKAIGDHIIKISLPSRQAAASGAEVEILLKIISA